MPRSYSMQFTTICRMGILLVFFVAGDVSQALERTISLPWIRQKTVSECGRAVLASLAARRGGDVEQFYRQLPEPPDRARGYSILEMQRFGANIGVNLTVVAPAGVVIAGECSPRPAVTAHFSRLASLVFTANPVVVPIASGVRAGHYLVLVGARSNGFILHDPASPGLLRMETSELAALMCDFGYVALVNR
jgi:hypothetical protein